jgi:hypothetical protein
MMWLIGLLLRKKGRKGRLLLTARRDQLDDQRPRKEKYPEVLRILVAQRKEAVI